MRKLIVLLAVLAIIIVACGNKEQTTASVPQLPAEQQDENEPAPPPVQNAPEATVVEDKVGAITGGEQKIPPAADVTDVKCTTDGRTLTFTLNNRGEKTWILFGTMPFPAPADQVKAKVFVNNYEANRKDKYTEATTGLKLFGPEATFPENCGGVTELKPGESATCTLAPVPLVQEDQYSNKNRVWVDAGYGDAEHITFTCT